MTAGTYSITLVIPGRPLNRNDRGHWRHKANATKQLRNATVDYAWEQWGPRSRTLSAVDHALGIAPWPKSSPSPMRPAAHITIADHCRTANLRDVDNADVKPIIDGLTDYGLWPDDGPKHVAGMTRLPPVKTGADQLVLTITWSTT